MISIRTRLWLALFTTALLLGGTADRTSSAAEDSHSGRITVKDFSFMPTPLTVNSGATVTWTNKDDEPHTVVSDTGIFRSGGMDTNESFSFTFDKPGTYHFTCSIHPNMVGTIVVR